MRSVKSISAAMALVLLLCGCSGFLDEGKIGRRDIVIETEDEPERTTRRTEPEKEPEIDPQTAESSSAPAETIEPEAPTTEADGYYMVGELSEEYDFYEIEWDRVPTINNLSDLADYLWFCLDNRVINAPVKYSDGFLPTTEQFFNIVNIPRCDNVRFDVGGGLEYYMYNLYYPSGMKIADAYLSGDKSQLDSDELAVYDIACQIVNEAKTYDTPMKQELYIHDIIAEYVTYYTTETDEDIPYFRTALGVFLDGEANCQGYADAFYMLGTMCGFEVDRIGGYANGGHVWNLIQLEDLWYSVDVCWDDDAFSSEEYDYIQYIYFNAPVEIISDTHSWDDYACRRELAQTLDGFSFYYTIEADDDWFGYHSDTAFDAVDYSCWAIENGDEYIYIMSPYDSDYDSSDEVNAYISDALTADGYYCSWLSHVEQVGDYLFFYIDSSDTYN